MSPAANRNRLPPGPGSAAPPRDAFYLRFTAAENLCGARPERAVP